VEVITAALRTVALKVRVLLLQNLNDRGLIRLASCLENASNMLL